MEGPLHNLSPNSSHTPFESPQADEDLSLLQSIELIDGFMIWYSDLIEHMVLFNYINWMVGLISKSGQLTRTHLPEL